MMVRSFWVVFEYFHRFEHLFVTFWRVHFIFYFLHIWSTKQISNLKEYKNVETSKQNKKYFYRLRATIIAHPEIVFEKWVSPKMVQETEKRWVTKNTFPQELLLLYLSAAAITTKKKMAFHWRLAEKKTAMYLLLSCLFSHNYKAVVLLAESFFRLFQSFFFLEEPKWNNLLSFVSKKALLFFSVKQEKFSTRPPLEIFCWHTLHFVLIHLFTFVHLIV